MSPEYQTFLESKYLLTDRVGPHPDARRSFGYALLDTRRSNIEALVKDPAVFDTNDIEDEAGEFYVRLGTGYSDRWMWLAHRMPVLRYAPVRWTLILGLNSDGSSRRHWPVARVDRARGCCGRRCSRGRDACRANGSGLKDEVRAASRPFETDPPRIDSSKTPGEDTMLTRKQSVPMRLGALTRDSHRLSI